MTTRGRGTVRARTLADGTKRYDLVVELPRDADGRRRQKTTTYSRRKDAERARAAVLSSIDQSVYIEPSKLTVRQYLQDRWLPAVEADLRPTTFASYRDTVDKHLVPRIGDLPLIGIGPDHFNHLKADLLASGRLSGRGGLSPTSVRYMLVISRKAFADAVRWQLLARSPLTGVTDPKVNQPEMKVWSADEARAFLGYVANDRPAAIWHLALHRGLRRGELVGLRWTEIDLNRGHLAVRQALVDVHFKVVTSAPKSGKPRVIALDPGTVAVLKAHRARQLEERMAWGPAWIDTGYLFTKEDGSALHPAKVSVAFLRLAKDADLPRIRFHDLRHTAAVLALQAGVHPKVVQEQLGHHSAAFTLDVYGHVTESMQADAAARVAAVLGS